LASVAYRVEAKRRRDNPETGKEGYKTVKRTFIKESDKIVHVTITNDDNSKSVTIDATPGYPFYVVGYGWQESKHNRNHKSENPR
jgi:hypothetical protein